MLHDLRARPWGVVAVVTVSLVGFQLLTGWYDLTSTAFAGRYNAFTSLMTQPVALVAPLIGILGGARFSSEVGQRHVVNVRMRTPLTRYFMGKLAAAAVVTAIVSMPLVLTAYLTAFIVWPALGDPNVDPSGYVNGETGLGYDPTFDTSYSQLLAISPEFYAVAYAIWMAFGLAVLSALGMGLLLVIRNRALALILPFLLYVVQDVVAQLTTGPTETVYHSIFPFGLQQSPILEAATPVLVMAVLVAAFWVVLIRNACRLARLN